MRATSFSETLTRLAALSWDRSSAPGVRVQHTRAIQRRASPPMFASGRSARTTPRLATTHPHDEQDEEISGNDAAADEENGGREDPHGQPPGTSRTGLPASSRGMTSFIGNDAARRRSPSLISNSARNWAREVRQRTIRQHRAPTVGRRLCVDTCRRCGPKAFPSLQMSRPCNNELDSIRCGAHTRYVSALPYGTSVQLEIRTAVGRDSLEIRFEQ